MTVKDPTAVCPPIPTVGARLGIRLPYGLTIGAGLQAAAEMEATIEDQCRQLQLLIGQVSVSLAFIIPVLKIAKCVKIIIELLQLLPDIITLVKPISDLTNKLTELDDCVNLFLEFTFFNIQPLCRLVLDVVVAIIAMLDCMISLLSVSIALGDRITELNASGDASLVLEAACILQQKGKIDLALEQKLSTIEAILLFINTLAGLVPPFAAVLGAEYPIQTPALSLNLPVLNAAKAQMEAVRDIVLTCA